MQIRILMIALLLSLSACNLGDSVGGNTSNVETGTLATHTPSAGSTLPETQATIPVPVTSSDGCEAVASASGITIDAEQERAEAPRTLPNGNAFPNTQPRQVNEGNNNSRRERSEVLIEFTPESSRNDRNAYIRQIGGGTRRQIDQLNTYVVTVRPNVTIESLPTSPIVVRSELNYTASASQVESTPNDPRYGEQWAFPVVGLPQAWATLPDNQTVIVAVIDSGVCGNHPDLQGRIGAGYDFVEDDNTPQDTFGHGCGVAGVIAANSNNGVGIAGIAPNVQIMPLRVLDGSGLGNYADISAAIVYAADNGARVINLSLAGPSFSSVMANAVAYAINKGVIVVAAAGNFGREGAFYPAAFPSVIAVGSVDNNLQQSSFSNFGADIDVWAPGRDILTTNIAGDYEFMTGTSFAAPVVAGITAMTTAMNAPLNTENGVVFLYPPENLPQCP